MDNTIPVLESPAMPAIRRVRDKAEENIEDLLDNVGEFQSYVEELNDYKWRLTDEQKVFLELALELSKRLEKDAAFIETTNAVFDCYTALEDTLDKKIYVTKDSIDLQEESLYLNLSAEEAVENRIEILEKELRPLMKRKRNLQLDIEYDVARLIRTRSSLARLREKVDRLHDDQDKICPDLVVAKKYKSEIEDLQADTVVAAYAVA
jgi:predicted  nucleic acid-binding Zn-ribbon protein